MEKRIRKVAECYTKFGLQHTSKSTACLKHSDRLFKKILFPKETSKLNNASFKGGNIVHDVVQLFVSTNQYETLDDVINSDKIQKEIDSYFPFNDKDKYKFKFIIKNLKATAQNHLSNLAELEAQTFKAEIEYTAWLPNVETYWLMYLDLVGTKNFGDLKNCFGAAKESPLKKPAKPKKDKPIVDNRIDDWVYSNVKVPQRPYFSDVMQIALYKHSCSLPPFLSYASNCDRKLFTENNCDELKQENLDQALKILSMYEVAWQKKLEIADGDVEKLAWLCVPDVSDIKKNTFMWENVPDDLKIKFLGIYGL